MRDAFGGAFMIQLLIVFIIIYVGFTAVALNYAKAFKAKNLIVEYLEDHEISDLTNLPAQADSDMFDYFQTEIVGNLGYVFSAENMCDDVNQEKTRCYKDIGILIEQIEPKENQKNKLGVYYKVTTYFGFQLPFFDRLFAVSGSDNGQNIIGKWRIVGETRTIAFE